MNSTLTQLYELLATLYCGLFVGLVYDVLRLFRRILRAGKFVTAIFDVIFWALTTLITAVALFYINGGALRLFSICGFFGGAMAYIFGFSPVLRGFWRTLMRPVRRLLGRINKNKNIFTTQEGESAGGVE